MDTSVRTYDLPNGHSIRFEGRPDVSADAYVVKLMDGDRVLSVTCSCNGATKTCATGKTVSCDCTKNPPVLSCS